MHCLECGNEINIDNNGISTHLIDGETDYDLDANHAAIRDESKPPSTIGNVFAVIAHESQFYTLYPLPLCHLAAAFDSEQEALEKLVTDRQTHVYGYKWTLSNPTHYAQVLWGMLGDVAVDEDDCIESTFLNFDVGTDRTEIWHWFEETFDVSVAEDLMKVAA